MSVFLLDYVDPPAVFTCPTDSKFLWSALVLKEFDPVTTILAIETEFAALKRQNRPLLPSVTVQTTIGTKLFYGCSRQSFRLTPPPLTTHIKDQSSQFSKLFAPRLPTEGPFSPLSCELLGTAEKPGALALQLEELILDEVKEPLEALIKVMRENQERTHFSEDEHTRREEYGALCNRLAIALKAFDPAQLPHLLRDWIQMVNEGYSDPTSLFLLGSKEKPGIIAKIAEKAPLDKTIRGKLNRLFTHIRENRSLILFSLDPNERRREYGEFCEKLALALRKCDPSKVANILAHFSSLNEICKTRWEECFDDEITPIATGEKAPTDPAAFCVRAGVLLRRSLIPKILAKFLTLLGGDIKLATDSHYSKCAKQRLNKYLELGYSSHELGHKEMTYWRFFEDYIHLFKQAVYEVEAQEYSRDQVEHTMKVIFYSMTEQEELLANVCSQFNTMMRKGELPPHPETVSTQSVIRRLEETLLIESPEKRWDALIEIREIAIEEDIDLPIPTKESVKRKLLNDLRQKAIRYVQTHTEQNLKDNQLRACMQDESLISLVSSLKFGKDSELYASYEAYKKFLASPEEFAPTSESISAICEEKKENSSEQSMRALRAELIEYSSGKPALTQFGVTVLRALSGDLQAEGSHELYNVKLLKACSISGQKKLQEAMEDLIRTGSPRDILTITPEEFLSKELVKDQLLRDPMLLPLAPKWTKKDKELLLELVRINPLVIAFADASLLREMNFVLLAIKSNPIVYIHLDSNLQDDIDVARVAVEHTKDIELVKKVVTYTPEAFEYVKQEWQTLRRDKEFMCAAVKTNVGILEYADEIVRKDRTVIYAAMQVVCNALQYADESIRKDGAFIIDAIKNSKDKYDHGFTYTFVDENLQQDKNFAIAYMNASSLSILDHLHSPLNADIEIFETAIQYDPIAALRFAGPNIRNANKHKREGTSDQTQAKKQK